MSFANKLVLAPWALKQLGVADFDRLSEILRAPEFEGWADDGGSKFVHQLIARLPKQGRRVADDQLRDYDSNIVGHLILARKPVKGFVKERPENGRETKQVCAAL